MQTAFSLSNRGNIEHDVRVASIYYCHVSHGGQKGNEESRKNTNKALKYILNAKGDESTT